MTKILFITSTRLGDAVLSTGLIGHILDRYPEPRLTIVCGNLPSSLFEGVPHLENLILLKKKTYKRHWWELWLKLRAQDWDIVVDLRNSIVSRFLKAGRKFIYRGGKGHKVVQNAVTMNLQDIPSPRLFPTSRQMDNARAIIPEGGAVLSVGPTANWIGKTWPSGCFVELIARLTAPGGLFADARVAVFAAPGEESEAYAVLHSIPENRRIDLIAKVTPGEAAAALARCDFFVGNDSGLMHCAAAAGIPTLGLFGASYVEIYGPYGEKTAVAHTPESFDKLKDFAGYDPKTLKKSLMTTLSVDHVYQQAEKLLANMQR